MDTDPDEERARLQGRIDSLEQLLEVHERTVLEYSSELEKRMKLLNQRANALAQSNAQLEEFAYVASHDLQEPLRKIQAFGDRLRVHVADKLDGKAIEYLTRMQNAAGRMQQLIDGLLAYSRITTRADAVRPVDLNDVLSNVLLGLSPRLQLEKTELEIGQLPTIDASPNQMRQLFEHLIANAIKFQRSGVPLVIRVSSASIGDGLWRIEITDNGMGFEKKYSEKVFGMYERLNGTKYEGTGVGLALCRKIVEHHGGYLTASSLGLGEGATFHITLPQTQPKKEDAQ